MIRPLPDWSENLLDVIKQHIKNKTYRISDHALEEMENDNLILPDIEYVLLHGRH